MSLTAMVNAGPAASPDPAAPETGGRGRWRHVLCFRVRYSETDQMGTVYNSRPLEWFECGRTELLRGLGLPYSASEARGVYLPLIESHLEYLGRARYDDLLEMTTTASLVGRARLRCDVSVRQAHNGQPVVRGYTVHAFTDSAGKPLRPPAWWLETLSPNPGAGATVPAADA